MKTDPPFPAYSLDKRLAVSIPERRKGNAADATIRGDRRENSQEKQYISLLSPQIVASAELPYVSEIL